MSPTAEHIHDATATITECSRWRVIPDVLHTRLLYAEFLTLPAALRRALLTSCASGAAQPASPPSAEPVGTTRGIAALFGLAAFLLCLSTVL